MPKYCYKEINFRPDSLRLIDTINGVIEEYTDQGFDLTLRQVYYQLVARDYAHDKRQRRGRLFQLCP